VNRSPPHRPQPISSVPKDAESLPSPVYPSGIFAIEWRSYDDVLAQPFSVFCLEFPLLDGRGNLFLPCRAWGTTSRN
jgi:hypothetical protein